MLELHHTSRHCGSSFPSFEQRCQPVQKRNEDRSAAACSMRLSVKTKRAKRVKSGIGSDLPTWYRNYGMYLLNYKECMSGEGQS